jgi:hypothetical protein
LKLGIRILVAQIVLAVPAALFAQWPAFPSKNVPKLPDGKPNLNGPTPRKPDGHPDLTGIWQFVDANRRVPPKAAASDTSSATKTAGKLELGRGFRSQFFDIGSTLKGGLPYTPWALALKKERDARNAEDNPDAHCLPMGLMQFHTHPQPRQIVQTRDEIVIMYEANYGLRQMFTDGRSLPNPDDVLPWWYGYSVGHWEGDTLVVETTGFRDDVWLDVEGSPMTSQAKMIERFSRPDFGHLKIDITVDDPKAYTHPWTVTVNQKIMLNTNLIEFICNENEQSDRHFAK